MQNQAPDKLIGQMIADRYELVECIENSPQAVVYRALDKNNSELKILKLLPSHNDERLSSFLSFCERVKTQIKHQDLAQLLDFGTREFNDSEEATVYLVFETLPGNSLHNILNRKGRIALQEAIKLFLQIAQISKSLHAAGIEFIQLSPNKIMLEEKAQAQKARLSDPGLSAYLSKIKAGEPSAGQFPESILYASPEQCAGHEPDHLSDIYSLGCIMYECLVGLPPFLSKDAYEVGRMHCNDEPKPLRMSRDDLNFPLELDLLVLKALRKNPGQRQQNMQELIDDLESVTKEINNATETARKERTRSSSAISDLFEDMFGSDSSIKVKLGIPIVLGFTIVFGSIAVGTILYSTNFKTTDAGSLSERQWQNLDNQAQRDLERGDTQNAEAHYLQALALAEAFGERDRRLLTTLRKLQDVYLTKKQFGKADEVEARIKVIMEKEMTE